MDKKKLSSETKAKHTFYDRVGFASSYYRKFCRSTKGHFLFQEEKSILSTIIPRGDGQPVLDVPTGNGRFLPFLREMGYRAIGTDISSSMMKANGKTIENWVCADAARLPFASRSFSGVLSHRFLYHYSSIEPYLLEFGRVLKPGGWLCFDLMKWSPSSVGRLFKIDFAGFIHVHPKRRVLNTIVETNFILKAEKEAFLLNPAWADLLPFSLVRLFLRGNSIGWAPRIKRYYLLEKKS